MLKTNKLAVLMAGILALTSAGAFASENQTFMDKVLDRAGHLGKSIGYFAGSLGCGAVSIAAVPSTWVATYPLELVDAVWKDLKEIKAEEARLNESKMMKEIRASTCKGPKILIPKKEYYFCLGLFSSITATCVALPLFIAYKSGKAAFNFGGKGVEEGKQAFGWPASANNEKIEKAPRKA
jgi:hypothetical protein